MQMTKAQRDLIDCIDQTTHIISELGLHDDLKPILADKKLRISQPELIVPIVGGFSAGKSTLINFFLGQKELLPTGTKPVTRLATELHYCENDNYAELIKEDKNGRIIEKKRIEVAELGQFADETQGGDNLEEYSCIKLYADNKKLKELQPFVLTDMPGFKSSNNYHNKAINRYIKYGTYFLLLNAAKDGTVDSSILNEINNIISAKKEFSFCLTKTDLIPPSLLDDVKENIEETLEDEVDYDKPIYTASIRENNTLGKMLDDIDKNKVIRGIYCDELEFLILDVLNAIRKNINVYSDKKLNFNDETVRFNKKKAALEADKNKILDALKNSKNSEQGVQEIVNQLKSKLIAESSSLIAKIENQTVFADAIGEIIKNQISGSLKTYLAKESKYIIGDFTEALRNITDGKGVGETDLESLKKEIEKMLDKTLLDLRDIGNSVNDSITSNDSLGGLLLDVVGRIVKNIPIVGAVFEVLTSIFGSSTNRRREAELDAENQRKRQEIDRRSQLRSVFGEEIVPNVLNKIKAILPDILNNFKADLITKISEQFKAAIDKEEKNFNQACENRGKFKTPQELEAEIAKNENAATQLRKLINQYLV